MSKRDLNKSNTKCVTPDARQLLKNLFYMWRVGLRDIAFSLPLEQHPCNLYIQKRYHARDSFREKTAFRVDVNVSINPRFRCVRDFDEDLGLSSFPFFTPHYSETLGRSIIIGLAARFSSRAIIAL